jgi:hypothetical protein
MDSLRTSLASEIASAQSLGGDIRTSVDAQQSAIRSDLDSRLAPLTGRGIVPRAATVTAVSSGLTCNGLLAVTVTVKDALNIIASATSAARNSYTTAEGVSVMVFNSNTLVASK